MSARLPASVKELTKCFVEKSLRPDQVAQRSLRQAEQSAQTVNAFVRLTPDVARKQATSSTNRYERGQAIGPLDGVPIAVKDNFCTKDVHTTCASRMLENFVPAYSATVYEKLERAGAVLIGKTNMDEFGMGSGTIDSIFGPTRNVWSKDLSDDNWRIAGGSSGGSAVAVASGICFGALGSDTGGSTRNPASYCGVVGLKPSYGLVSRHGLIPLVNSMDVPGLITQRVDDCALLLNTLAGPDPLDSTTIKKPYQTIVLPKEPSIAGLRIGLPVEFNCEGLSDEMLITWRQVADLLANGGAKIVDKVSLPNTVHSIFVYSILNQCEVSSNMARYDGIQFGHRATGEDFTGTEQLYARTRAKGFSAVVKNRILAGNYFLLRRNYDKYFCKALQVRRLIADDFERVFTDNVDVLLTPTTLSEAPLFSDFKSATNRDQCAVQDFCTQPANMAGIPAISVPVRLSRNGMPLSIQIMAPMLGERTLLNVAKWIEQRVSFPFRAE